MREYARVCVRACVISPGEFFQDVAVQTRRHREKLPRTDVISAVPSRPSHPPVAPIYLSKLRGIPVAFSFFFLFFLSLSYFTHNLCLHSFSFICHIFFSPGMLVYHLFSPFIFFSFCYSSSSSSLSPVPLYFLVIISLSSSFSFPCSHSFLLSFFLYQHLFSPFPFILLLSFFLYHHFFSPFPFVLLLSFFLYHHLFSLFPLFFSSSSTDR